MKKLWYCLFYALCVFTLAFSFAWMLPRRSGLPPASSGEASSGSALPDLAAQGPASGVALPQGFYLCDEGGRLAVYTCDADGQPLQRVELTEVCWWSGASRPSLPSWKTWATDAGFPAKPRAKTGPGAALPRACSGFVLGVGYASIASSGTRYSFRQFSKASA